MPGLEGDLASMHRECDYWHRRAEEAEKASTFSQQQTSAAFEQARLGPVQSALGGTSCFSRGREWGNTRIILWRTPFSITIMIPRLYLLPS